MPIKSKKKKTRAVSTGPTPPPNYRAFIKQYPKLAQAWELIGSAGRQGPLDSKAARLIKLAVAMGAMREGAVHSNVRRALAERITVKEIQQVVVLAAGTLGMSATAAIFSWVQDVIKKKKN